MEPFLPWGAALYDGEASMCVKTSKDSEENVCAVENSVSSKAGFKYLMGCTPTQGGMSGCSTRSPKLQKTEGLN